MTWDYILAYKIQLYISPIPDPNAKSSTRTTRSWYPVPRCNISTMKRATSSWIASATSSMVLYFILTGHPFDRLFLVGHCHPKVVDAITKQLSTSTCNVRFVSTQLTDCAEQILSTLPGLDTVLFCNSG